MENEIEKLHQDITKCVRDRIGSLMNKDNRLNILLVEDSKLQRVNLKKKLEALNLFNFFEAENGREGIDILKQNRKIAAAFVDVEMPVMTGKEFVAQALEENLINNSQIIMVTSIDDEDTVFELFVAGISAYIVKPVNETELLKKLHTVLSSVIM